MNLKMDKKTPAKTSKNETGINKQLMRYETKSEWNEHKMNSKDKREMNSPKDSSDSVRVYG